MLSGLPCWVLKPPKAFAVEPEAGGRGSNTVTSLRPRRARAQASATPATPGNRQPQRHEVGDVDQRVDAREPAATPHPPQERLAGGPVAGRVHAEAAVERAGRPGVGDAPGASVTLRTAHLVVEVAARPD